MTWAVAMRGDSAANTDSIAQDTALVEFLVAQHLTLSQVAQKQDLADPRGDRAIRRAASGDERTLVALYLLTVADIRGTSPKVWNAWKGKLLEDLVSLDSADCSAVGRSHRLRCSNGRKQEAMRILRLYGVIRRGARSAVATVRRGLFPAPRRAGHRVAHAVAVFAGSSADKPIVRARLARIGEGAEVLVYVKDQKGLFARVCGYFDSRNLSILDARCIRRGTAMRSTHFWSPITAARATIVSC